MQTVWKCFILLILSYKVSKNTALLRCTATTRRSSDLVMVLCCYYKWYERLLIFFYYNSAVPQPFLLLIAANLAQAGFLGWKWSLWPMPTWLAVKWSKALFLLALYDSMNDMNYLCCTANQAGIDHKLHFQPKHPARAKLAPINNKNGCGNAEV